jgi:hypothetical protein
MKGGINLYAYCEGRVITKKDNNGNEPKASNVLSLGLEWLESELATNGFYKGTKFNMTEANAARATQLTGQEVTMTVRAMEGFSETFAKYNKTARASGELVETALKGEGITARTGRAISSVFINSRGVTLTAEAEKTIHTAAELGAVKRAVESGKHAVAVLVEGESGLQIFAKGSKSIGLRSTVNLLADTPVKSFAGAKQIATALKPLRPLATGTIALASKLAPAVSRLAPVVSKAAPVVKALAPAAKFLGKAAGPLGIGIGIAQMATAKDTEGKIDGGITATSSALLMSPHPLAKAAGAGLATGHVIEKTLDVSKYSSGAGMFVNEGLQELGANETASLIAGGVVTVASTPVAIGVAAVDKTIDFVESRDWHKTVRPWQWFD